jgi:tetratricopeptide (TPR) repeat protein
MLASRRTVWAIAAVMAASAAAVAPHLSWRVGVPPRGAEPGRIAPAIGMPGAPPTSAEGLRQRILETESRLREHPGESGTAILLADALLRQSRVTTDGRPANRAAEVLGVVLRDDPGQYDALRLLGAVQLSRHRFRDALEVARRARDERPGDAWNYGVMGDALLELGEYDQAFDAFDRMVTMRPSADAYARVSYARELRGDLEGALAVMLMAAEATTAHDLEAKAWYTAHTGELLLRVGRLDEAERAYRRAAYLFPRYPYAIVGLGKAAVARGDCDGALDIFLTQFRRTPTLDLAARVGDLYAARGNTTEAEHYYQVAEELAGPGIAQTDGALALFLAERNRKLPDAARIAQGVAATRNDIFTDDALAWALYKNGRISEAYVASQRAMRTGTRDARILEHAATIRSRIQHAS